MVTVVLNNYGQCIPTIRLEEAIEHPQTITTRDFIKDVTYVRLSTSSDCLVGVNPKISVTKSYILITTDRKCLLFDRYSGTFIREIGHYGKDPGGYRYAYGFFNESTLTCYFIGWNHDLVIYTLDNVYKGVLKVPGSDSSSEYALEPGDYSFINDKVYVFNALWLTGKEPFSVIVFDEKGKRVFSVPNRNFQSKDYPLMVVTKEVRFHRFNSNLYFQDRYNDTVFKLGQNMISPAFILDRGKRKPLFESRWWPLEKWQKAGFILQPEYFESRRFVSFYFDYNNSKYFAFYDKQLKITKVGIVGAGIENSSDGFINLGFSSINESGELSGLIQPYEIMEWIKQNPAKFKALSPELKKLGEINAEDNPIVVIANCKN